MGRLQWFHRGLVLGVAGLVALTAGIPAQAQSGNFELELNTATEVPDACRLTFVATNATGVALTSTAYEVAAFNAEGGVTTLLVLEFGELPLSKTRVVQFDLPDLACTDLSRIVVNGQDQCKSAEGDSDVCMKLLSATSRIPTIRFGL